MNVPELGGRLPLLRPEDLTAEQKTVYDLIGQTMVPWAEKVGFQSRTADGSLIGPFNAILHSPAITTAFLKLQEAEGKASSLGERVRQVVILSVGAGWQSPYELYAHSAVARTAGLPEAAIRELAAGGLPEGLEEAEKAAALFTRRLTSGHRVDDALYGRAEAAFGPKGLVDMIYLAGCYHIVCGLLNAFQVPAPSGGFPAAWARPSKAGTAKLETVALFPVESFLENLAVRSDNSVLVTNMNARELFYVPPFAGGEPVQPVLLHTFDQPATGLVEVEPDLFLVSSSNIYTTHESFLHRLDLRGWTPGARVRLEQVFRFPAEARGLNGSCLLAPGVVLVADCFAGLIWRLDMAPGAANLRARVWLRHGSMGYFPGKLKPEQPGVNGVRYAARTNQLYYTATAKKLLMRVAVDPATLEPAGEPEVVLAGRMGDDFCIDEDAGVLFLTTHRQNTIDRVSMDPGDNSGFTDSVAGDPFDEQLIGPSSGAWGRASGEYGRVAYVISDGGTASPPPDGPRAAKLLRVTLSIEGRRDSP